MNMHAWLASLYGRTEPAILAECYYPCVGLTEHPLIPTLDGTDAKGQAEVIRAAVQRYPQLAAAFTAVDVTVEAEAFGCAVAYSETAAPMTVSTVVHTPEDANGLTVPGVHAGRQDFGLDVIRTTKELITDRPVFGMMMGPFSLAGMLMRYADVMTATVKQPEGLHTLLKKVNLFLTARARAMKEAGADGVMILEPSAGMIPPKHRKQFSSDYVKEIVDCVKDDTFVCALHNCGRVRAEKCGDLIDTGVKILSVGASTDLKELCAHMEDRFVMGNLDPLYIAGAEPEEIEAATGTLLADMQGVSNFILGPACDLPMKTTPERLDAFMNCVTAI